MIKRGINRKTAIPRYMHQTIESQMHKAKTDRAEKGNRQIHNYC